MWAYYVRGEAMKQTVLSIHVIGAIFALAGVALAADRPVTFTKDIAPIFEEKCQECHRPRVSGADVAGNL